MRRSWRWISYPLGGRPPEAGEEGLNSRGAGGWGGAQEAKGEELERELLSFREDRGAAGQVRRAEEKAQERGEAEKVLVGEKGAESPERESVCRWGNAAFRASTCTPLPRDVDQRSTLGGRYAHSPLLALGINSLGCPC